MARKTKSGRHQFNLAEELKDVINDYAKTVYESKEAALDKASDYLMEKLEENSPKDTGTLSRSWTRSTEYKNVRYIWNTAEGGKNKEYEGIIPLANLVEFSYKGRPFIRKTFDANKEKIIEIIKKGVENGDTK